MTEAFAPRAAAPVGWWALAAAATGAAVGCAAPVWLAQSARAFGAEPSAQAVARVAACVGLGLGAWLGGVIADRRDGQLRVALVAQAAAGGAALAFPLLLAAASAFRGGESDAARMAAVLVPALAVGALLPALVRHVLRRPAAPARRAAEVLGAAAAGAGLGVVVAHGVALAHAGPLLVLVLAAALHGLAAFALREGREHDALPRPLAQTALVPLDAALEREIARGRARAAKRQRRRVRFDLRLAAGLAAVLSGFAGATVVAVSARALALPLGSRTAGAVGAAACIALGLGAWFGARLAGPGRSARPARGLAALGATWLGLGAATLLAAAVLSHFVRLAARSQGHEVGWPSALAQAAAAVAPALFFAGLQVPLWVGLIARGAVGAGRTVGVVVAGQAVGAAGAATVLFGGVALSALGAGGVLSVAGWGALVLGLVLVVRGLTALGRPLSTALVRSVPAWLVAGGAQLAMGGLGPDGALGLEARAGARLVAHAEGPAATAALVEDADGERAIEMAGERHALGRDARHAAARRALVSLLLADAVPGEGRVLCAGLDGGLEAAALLAVGAGASLEVADARAELFPLLRHDDASGRALWDAMGAGRVRLHARDPRRVWAADGAPWSLLVLIAGPAGGIGGGPPPDLSDLAAARAALAPDGACVLWLPVERQGLERSRALARTFASAFPGAGATWELGVDGEAWVGLVGAREPADAPARARVERRIEALNAAPEASGSFAAAFDAPAGVAAVGGWIADGAALEAWCDGATRLRRWGPRGSFAPPRAGADVAAVLEAWAAAGDAASDRDPLRRGRRLAVGAVVRARAAGVAGDPAGALRAALEALDLDPEWAGAARAVGAAARSVARAGAPDAAAAAAARLAGGAHAAEGEAIEAEAALAVGDRAGAEAHARRALELDGLHPAARALLRRLTGAPSE